LEILKEEKKKEERKKEKKIELSVKKKYDSQANE